MEQDLNTAFLILFVGMTTVFLILALVVITGKLLIKIVNRYYPTPIKKVDSTAFVDQKTQYLSNDKLAVIVAAVEMVTQGRGRVESVNKEKLR